MVPRIPIPHRAPFLPVLALGERHGGVLPLLPRHSKCVPDRGVILSTSSFLCPTILREHESRDKTARAPRSDFDRVTPFRGDVFHGGRAVQFVPCEGATGQGALQSAEEYERKYLAIGETLQPDLA